MSDEVGTRGTRRARATLRLLAGETLRWGDRVDLGRDGEVLWHGVGVDVDDDVSGTCQATLVFGDASGAADFVATGTLSALCEERVVGRATPVEGAEARSGRWVERLVAVADEAADDGQDVDRLVERAAAERLARLARGRHAPDEADLALAALLESTGPLPMTEDNPGWKPAAAVAILGALGVRAFAGVSGEHRGAPDATFAVMLDAALRAGTVTLCAAGPGEPVARKVLRAALGLAVPAKALAPVPRARVAALGRAIAGARADAVRYAAAALTRGAGGAEPPSEWMGGATGADRDLLSALGVDRPVGDP